MKVIIHAFFFATISVMSCTAQNQNTMEHKVNTSIDEVNPEVERVKEVISEIEKAASTRDIEKLKNLLHDDYRVVANRFKGGESAIIITRDAYFEMMKLEKVGGTSYDEVKFNEVTINEHTAMVDLDFTSKEMPNMHKFLVLILDKNDQWKVVTDIPIVSK